MLSGNRLAKTIIYTALMLISAQSAFAFGFIEHMVDDDLDAACFAYAADLNGDGLKDIVATGWDDNCVTIWYENEGGFTFTPHDLPSTTSGRHVMCADLDGDGDNDIILSAINTGFVVWWENDGSGSFTYHVADSSAPGAHTSDVCDIDGDGDLDILTACWSGGVLLLENDGEENFTQTQLGAVGDGNTSIVGVDIDSDNDLDILATQYQGSAVTWWENEGSSVYTMHELPMTINGAHWADADDMDSDGDIDFVIAAFNSSRVYWLENDGNQEFTLNEIMSLGGASWIEAGDIDLDGDMDILVSGETANRISWLENDGLMNITNHTVKTGWARVMGEQLLDFDDDGDIDFVGAAVNANEVMLFENDSNYAQATNSWISDYTPAPSTGEVTITAEILDQGATDIEVFAVMQSEDGAIAEEEELFDDGQHDDGEAGDGIWGATYTTSFWEAFYEVIIRVENNEASQIHEFHNNLYFTTCGPLEFEGLGITLASDTIPEPGESTSFAAMFRNMGVQGIFSDIRMDVTIEDTLVLFGNGTITNHRYLPDITPGQIAAHLSPLTINIDEEFPVDTDIHFDIRLSYLGTEFYQFTGLLHVYGGSEVKHSDLPTKFQINQCYPNPFNSALRVEFILPQSSNMAIDVYNLLGEKVESICHEYLTAGKHIYSYTPENLASGTYLLRFNSDISGEHIRKVLYVR